MTYNISTANLHQRIYRYGIIAFSILSVLAIVFYKERTIFLDNSFFLFEILRTGSPTVQRYRFISAIPQSLPVLAEKLSLSLKWVMISFSAGFMLFQFACYLVTGSILKNYKLAIALLLFNTLFATHVFFWGLSELILGIGLMFPLFALLMQKHTGGKKLSVAIVLLITFLVAFSHPLIIFPYLFAAAFFWLSNAIARKKLVWVTVALLFLFTFKIIFLSDAYEHGAGGALIAHLLEFFPDYLNIYANTVFVENLFSIYYWIPLSLILITGVYIKNGCWLKIMLVISFFTGYLFMINITYATDATKEFYIENMYMPLAVVLAIPLLYDVLPRLGHLPTIVVITLIISCSFIRIGYQKDFYSERLDWYRAYLQKNKNIKVMTSYDGRYDNVILQSWATPYEFWLLSTFENDSTASVIMSENIEEISWAYDRKNDFVTQWGVFNYGDLNPMYFKFRDTGTHYTFNKEQ